MKLIWILLWTAHASAAWLWLSADPKNAAVYIDGQYRGHISGNDPLKLKISKGQHQLRLYWPEQNYDSLLNIDQSVQLHIQAKKQISAFSTEIEPIQKSVPVKKLIPLPRNF